MKKLFKKLPLVAFVLALGGAFAFNMPEERAVATQWFNLDVDGDVHGTAMSSSPACPGGGNYCAVEVDDSQLNPETGLPQFSNIEQASPSQYIQYIEKN